MTRTLTMTITEIAATIHGTSNDTAFWAGWRDNDDRWARRYLREAIRAGADRAGSAKQIADADAALGRLGR